MFKYLFMPDFDMFLLTILLGWPLQVWLYYLARKWTEKNR